MNRLGRLLIMLSFLFPAASCAPTLKQPGPPTVEARLEPDAVTTPDDQRLPLRHWLPDGAPKAVIIALHGMNDYSHAFEEPGRYLANHGIAVYAFDQRGFGQGPWPGYWAGEQAMVEDADTVTRLIASHYPGVPLYLLGESMGGAVVILAMTGDNPPPVTGVILSAPAVWGRDDMNIFERGMLWMSSHTLPWMTLTGHGLQLTPSDNFDMLRALSMDPLVIKETRIDAVHGLVDLMTEAQTAATRLSCPTLALYGEKDEIIPATPSHRVMAHLSGPPGSQVAAIYREGYHMLLRDMQAKRVLDDIVAWIAEPHQPLPSGADARANQVLARLR